MMFSKKIFLTVMALATTVSVSMCSEQPTPPQLSLEQLGGIAIGAILPGPCVLIHSMKNLFFAKKLEELMVQPGITQSIEKEAHLLRKRGLRSFAFGTILSLPLVSIMYKLRQASQNNNELKSEMKELIAKS